MVLALNAGTSSLKFKVIDTKILSPYIQGTFKNQVEDVYELEIIKDGKEEKRKLEQKDYEFSIDYLIQILETEFDLALEKLQFVVHRVVHGGEEFIKPTLLDEEIIKKIEKFNSFAPLHNPFALERINYIHKKYPHLEQYAVFDTSFHSTNEKIDYLYGLPYGYYENLGVRRFGFHGTSHEYIAAEIERIEQKKEYKLISCHLGSGSSICAIQNGKSVDHSFGFTPNENLIMSTRSGEVDYDAIKFLKNKLGLNDEDVDKLLNKESGFLGISGYTKDMRTLIDDYASNPRAKLTIDMYVNSIIKFIAYFYFKLSDIDYLVFTGGIGVGGAFLRELITNKLELIGIKIDKDLNTSIHVTEAYEDISDPNSRIKTFIINTDEETEMVKNVIKMLK
jgi:acetate kinase